jgi:hypothetical protein
MASYTGSVPTYNFPPIFAYAVLTWEVSNLLTALTVDASIRRAYEDRPHAEVTARVAVIAVATPAERDQLGAVIEYLSTKVHPGDFSYALSPALPPGVWTGRRTESWDEINAITLGPTATAALRASQPK